jgi:hypothetical protein
MKKDKPSIVDHLLQVWLNGYIGYVWAVIVNIFTIFVAFAIFASIYGDFETIIVCIAILIYLNLNSFSSFWGLQKGRELFALGDEFQRIRKLLEENKDNNEDYETEVENSKNNFRKQEIKFRINLSFAFFIYIITLLKLFSAL